MDDVTDKTLKHLEKCLSAIPPALTPCKINIGYAASQIKTEASVGSKKTRTDSNEDLCQFCYSKADETRTKIEILSKRKCKKLGQAKKGRVAKSELQKTCHVCQRVFFKKTLPAIVRPVSASTESRQSNIRNEEVGLETGTKKKKRKKKDPNAGLIIPGKSSTAKTPTPAASCDKKVKISKEKLDRLLKLGNGNKKGGLEQFLKLT